MYTPHRATLEVQAVHRSLESSLVPEQLQPLVALLPLSLQRFSAVALALLVQPLQQRVALALEVP